MRFSVIVPAYNEAAYLGRALDSLLHQDYDGKYEVIVVDNNSSDDTAAIAARYGVHVVREPQQGVCAARQRGVDCARGEIIISTDADTTQPRDWLRTIDARFAESDRVVAVAGPCRYKNPSWWAKAYPILLFGLVAAIYALTGFVFYVSATNFAIRRTAFPGYDLKLTQGGDELDLLRRLRRRGAGELGAAQRRDDLGAAVAARAALQLLRYLPRVLRAGLLAQPTVAAADVRDGAGFPARTQATFRSVWVRRRVVLGILVVGLTSLGFATGAGGAAVDSLANLWHGP